MPIRFEGDRAMLEQVCAVEEAEPLLEWLRSGDAAAKAVDLSACDHAHTAVVQVLLAVRPVIAAPPADPTLARVLRLAPGAEAAPP